MVFNNYTNPYQYPLPYQRQPVVTNHGGLIWVQGEAGAKGYPVEPGNTVLLMDSETDCFYIKSTDSSGIPSPLRIFSYNEITNATNIPNNVKRDSTPEYVTREEFEELKKMINDRQAQRRENVNGKQAFSRNPKQQSNE